MTTEADTVVAAEVVEQHDLLAHWLGSTCGQEVLDALRAAHTADFSMVTTSGETVTASALLDGLARAGNAQPGLRIEVRDIEVVLRTADHVLVRFTEEHTGTGDPSARKVTAMLRYTDSARNGLLWHHVHETPVS